MMIMVMMKMLSVALYVRRDAWLFLAILSR
jgi:hypothetical protein